MRVVFACAVLALTLFSQAGTSQSGKGEDSFFSGPPFNLKDLLQRVGVIADKRLRIAVERRGVDFSPKPADIEKLKQAGASSELIQAVIQKAPAAAPPPKAVAQPPKPVAPPPPAHAGKVSFQCVPAECEVVANSNPRGSTSGGSIELAELPTGENVIEFRKEGFEDQQLTLSLKPGSTVTQTITLKPNAATQGRLGQQLYDRMLAKLGGPPALKKEMLVSGTGNASLFQENGERTEWQFTSRLKLPSLAMIEITGAGLKWWTSLKADDSKAGGAPQMTGSPVALEMEKLVRFYRDYQLAVLIERWRGMTLTAPGAAPINGQWRLRANNNDDAYTVYLDPDYTPRRVVYESGSGLGSGMEVVYSDFIADKEPYYKTMVIKFSAQQQHGLELQFRVIEFPDKLADKEFHR